MPETCHRDLKALAKAVVEEFYQAGLKALESELTASCSLEQLERIERYKKIHQI